MGHSGCPVQPALPERRIEALKQRPENASLGGLFPKQPDRARIREAVRQPRTQKPHERQTVVDQEFGAFVGRLFVSE